VWDAAGSRFISEIINHHHHQQRWEKINCDRLGFFVENKLVTFARLLVSRVLRAAGDESLFT